MIDYHNPVSQEDFIETLSMFATSLREFYGDERGQELWEAVSAILPTEEVGKLLFAQLTTGSVEKHVTLVSFDWTIAQSQIVPAIKLFREYTGNYLKESKDALFLARDDTATSATIRYRLNSGRSKTEFIAQMRNLGVTVR